MYQLINNENIDIIFDEVIDVTLETKNNLKKIIALGLAKKAKLYANH